VKPVGIPEMNMWMYTKYKWSWERAQETKMALSPFSVHFGHYIAGVANNLVRKLNANDWLASGMA